MLGSISETISYEANSGIVTTNVSLLNGYAFNSTHMISLYTLIANAQELINSVAIPVLVRSAPEIASNLFYQIFVYYLN